MTQFTVAVSTRVPSDIAEALSESAARRAMSRSTWLRQAILGALKAEELMFALAAEARK
jgi:predicted transcriptional regulator